MFVVELTFAAPEPDDADGRRLNAITSLTAALLRNENLLEFSIASGAYGWTVYGLAPAKDAFYRSNRNKYVQQGFAGLRQVGLKHPRVRFLGIAPETASSCECTRRSGFFLFTTFLHLEPPLRCIRCNGTVPTYRLPRPSTDEYSGLLSWKSNYKACDTLQMNCDVGEQFGSLQMSDPTSKLSRSGLTVCKEIARLTGRPTYYYLHKASARSRTAEASRLCPGCGGEWLLKKPLHGKFDFKCDKCRLLSNIAWNVR
jgi:predicted  nucleic acid-binding Zn ribbon protein